MEQIIKNPYYQYFIGLSGYQEEVPFAPSLLVEFRKRLTDEILSEINEMIAQYNRPDDPSDGGSSGTDHDEKPDEKIRKAVKKQLQYVKRDLGYIEMFLETGDVELTDKQLSHMRTIPEVYEPQEYMYKTGTHSLKDHIVSIGQPYIRPIVRGKAKAPVEFGAKLDMSIDENGIARLERISFEAYNEADVLINAIENCR